MAWRVSAKVHLAGSGQVQAGAQSTTMNPMKTFSLGQQSWERTMLATELVRIRLQRMTTALEQAKIPYAVIGDCAVAAWIGRVDPSAVRFAKEIDLLIRRSDLEAAKSVLEPAGFIYLRTASQEMFLDSPEFRARDCVYLVFAGERVSTSDMLPAPDVIDAEAVESFHVLGLLALVRMKLTSYRDKDRTHLRDMIEVGLIDQSWPAKLPAELALRLQALLDTLEG